jgi:hypothetical protein
MSELGRKRGGCLTAFLILMLIVNPLTAIYYLIAGSKIRESLPSMPAWAIPVLIICGIANFAFALAILNWKKLGVYGIVAIAVVAFIINLMSGLPVAIALMRLVGVAILLLLVRPVWDKME